MKLVINRCYGGFGLSAKAVRRLAELEGRDCYLFTHQRTPEYDLHTYIPVSDEQAQNDIMFFAFDVPNPNEVIPSSRNFRDMSPEQREESNRLYTQHSLKSGRDLDRANPNLVQVVEEMGKEASSRLAELSVVEIPDGVEYEIDEYDGIESIHEVHRSWS